MVAGGEREGRKSFSKSAASDINSIFFRLYNRKPKSRFEVIRRFISAITFKWN